MDLSAGRLSDLYDRLDRMQIQQIISRKEGCEHFCTVKDAVVTTARPVTAAALSTERKQQAEDDDDLTTATTVRSSLKICEKYKPSFTSKKEQISVIRDRIKLIRQSKLLMKETMKAIDGMLDESYKNDEHDENCHHKESIEEFYKSKRCLSSSLNISSLNANLPRTDINPPKYIEDANKNIHRTKTEKLDTRARTTLASVVPTSIFEPFNEFTFTDKSLLENRKRALENRKKSQLNKRVLSAGFSLVRNGYHTKSDSDRGAYHNTKSTTIHHHHKCNNKKHVQLKPRISSAH